MIVGNYEASNNTIKALRTEYAITNTTGLHDFGLHFEVYNLIKLLKPQDKGSFQNLYDSIYRTRYEELNKKEKKEAGSDADKKVSDLLQKLDNTRKK